MTSDPLFLLAGLAAGFLVGTAYFAALWASTRALARSGRMRGLLLGAGLRLAALLFAFGLALQAGVAPAILAAAMAGFLLARLGATRLARPQRAEG